MTLKKNEKRFLLIASIAIISTAGVVPFLESAEAAGTTGHTYNGKKSTIPNYHAQNTSPPKQDTSHLGTCGVNMSCAGIGTCGVNMSCKT